MALKLDSQFPELKKYMRESLFAVRVRCGRREFMETEPETGRTEDVFNEGIKSMKTKSRVCRRSVKTTQARA